MASVRREAPTLLSLWSSTRTFVLLQTQPKRNPPQAHTCDAHSTQCHAHSICYPAAAHRRLCEHRLSSFSDLYTNPPLARCAALPTSCLILPPRTLHPHSLCPCSRSIPTIPSSRIRPSAIPALPIYAHFLLQHGQRVESHHLECTARQVGRIGFCRDGCVLLSQYRHFLLPVTTAFKPSRTQLLLLDLLIITLSVIVTTVAYETAYARAVTKAAIRARLDLTPAASSPARTYTDPLGDSDDVVLDLRASLLFRHVRRPPAPPPDDAPLPNGATIVEGLRVLLQAQRSFRARQQTPPPPGSNGDDAETQDGERERERRVPGGMDPPEDS